MKFTHVGIKVVDMQKSIDFYHKVLNCSIENKVNKGETELVFMNAHGITIELIYKPKHTLLVDGPINHIAFEVDDLDAKVAELKSLNIELDTPILPGSNGRIVFFRGPNNERFEYMGK